MFSIFHVNFAEDEYSVRIEFALFASSASPTEVSQSKYLNSNIFIEDQ